MTGTDKVVLGGDDRLRKDDGAGSRGDRSGADLGRTETDGTVLSKTERRMSFRDEWTANALPTPPAIPGYHLCWLSTTNTADPIHVRMRMGYQPVGVNEVPGFEHYKMKSGEWEGMVSCNEMLLFKIDDATYREMLTYFHHEKPLSEEEMITNHEAVTTKNAVRVADLDEDGLQQLGRNVRPVFNL